MNAKELLNLLKPMKSLKNTNMHILDNMLIERGESTSFFATDLSNQVCAKVMNTGDDVIGKFIVHKDRFLDILYRLSNEKVDAFKFVQKCSNAIEVHGVRLQYQLKTINPDDYPTMPKLHNNQDFDIAIDRESFMQAYQRARPFTGTKHCSIGLPWVVIDIAESAIYTTNGHVLAKCKFNRSGGSQHNTENSGGILVVSTQSMDMICNNVNTKRTNDDIYIKLLDNNNIQFSVIEEELNIITKNENLDYPDLESLVPKNKELQYCIKLNRQEMLKAIRNVAMFKPDLTLSCVIKAKHHQERYIIEASNDTGYAKDEIKILSNKTDLEADMMFAVHYLETILKSLSEEEICWSLQQNAKQSHVFQDNHSLFVIMPLF